MRALELTAADLDKVAGGSCAQTDPELFFPPANVPIAFEDAATVCFYCPVKVACLEGARARREPWGVWGGVNFEKDPSAEPFDPTANGWCGTPSGRKRHLKRGQEPCDECKEARTKYDREMKARRRAQLRANREGLSA